MAQLGQGTLLLALALSIFGIGLSVVGERKRIPRLALSGVRALIGVAVLVAIASGILLAAFVTHDYSFSYVSGRSSRDMPLYFIITAFYGGQEGSLLFWTLIVSVIGAIAFARNRERFPGLVPYATATLLVVIGFLLYILSFVATPFAVNLVTPGNGRGLNPLLRDPGMLIHPPLLLAGFATLAIPFAITVAALISGRMTTDWLRFVRRWALVSWAILSAGIFLGGWWAYHVLGWGGYWAWDPVENVSLLPWLTLTAFVHSIMVQERRGMLKTWNVGLLLSSFLLSIFGTFIVRSGLISSVHSFALSDIGPYFLGFLATMTVASVAILIWRLPLMRSENTFESVWSRESGFLLNNLVFTAIAFATLWGTIYPLVTEAFQGTAITVGAPFYNQVNGPLLLTLLLLMGVGPLLAWRRTVGETLLRSLSIPFGLAIVSLAGVLFLFGQPMAAIGAAAAVFAIGAVVVEYWRGVRLRRKNAGDSVPAAIYRLTRRDPRRFGGYIVHLGVAIMALGIVGSWFFNTERQVILNPGDSVDVAGYTVGYERLGQTRTADARVVTAHVNVSSSGNDHGSMEANRFTYDGFEDQTTTRVAINTVGFDDVYVMLLEWDDGGAAHLRIFVNPLVNWVWAGGAVYLLGMGVLFWPAPSVAPVTARSSVRKEAFGEATAD
ncbi:MAG: heme lyase CcmF/NrfE family subunit [Chloroflexia bacterium]|nr:heme lyase CcmF/NrfE family subunit [Chloroflexia bacterium]